MKLTLAISFKRLLWYVFVLFSRLTKAEPRVLSSQMWVLQQLLFTALLQRMHLVWSWIDDVLTVVSFCLNSINSWCAAHAAAPSVWCYLQCTSFQPHLMNIRRAHASYGMQLFSVCIFTSPVFFYINRFCGWIWWHVPVDVLMGVFENWCVWFRFKSQIKKKTIAWLEGQI